MIRMESERRLKITAIIFSIVIVLLYVVGVQSKLTVIDKLVEDSPLANIVIIAFISLLSVCLLYFAISYVWAKISCSETDGSIVQSQKRLSATKLTILLLVAWIPYLIIRFPENVDTDTLWQLMQPYGFKAYSDHHPFFDTLLFGLFWKIGDVFGSNTISLLLYSILQMTGTAFAFSYALDYCRNKYSVSTKAEKAAVLFYALFPIVPMFTETMAKDMLHGCIFVVFLVMFFKVSDSEGGVLQRIEFFVGFMGIIVAMMLTKKTGVYVCIVSLVFLLFKRKNVFRIILSIVIPCTVFFGLWNGIILDSLNVQKGSEGEMLSVPSQQVAYLIREHGDSFSDDDWAVLEEVYDNPRAFGEIYVPNRADNIKNQWRGWADTGVKIDFLKWYLKQYFVYPKEMILAVGALDYPLLGVDYECQGDESLLFYRDGLPSRAEPSPAVESVFSNWTGGAATKEDIHNVFSTAYRGDFISKMSVKFNTIYLELIQAVPVLFSKILYTIWIPLFVLFYRFYRKKSIIRYIPVIINELVLFVGPIVLPRYLVNSVYIAPILLLSMVDMQDRELKNNTFENGKAL